MHRSTCKCTVWGVQLPHHLHLYLGFALQFSRQTASDVQLLLASLSKRFTFGPQNRTELRAVLPHHFHIYLHFALQFSSTVYDTNSIWQTNCLRSFSAPQGFDSQFFSKSKLVKNIWKFSKVKQVWINGTSKYFYLWYFCQVSCQQSFWLLKVRDIICGRGDPE